MASEKEKFVFNGSNVDYSSITGSSNSRQSYEYASHNKSMSHMPDHRPSSNKSSGDNVAAKLEKQKFGSEADLLSSSKISSLETQFRRKLYNELPFISAFGMTNRETTFKKTMSMEGLNNLSNVENNNSNEVCSSVLIAHPAFTILLIVAFFLHFFVGYSKCHGSC